MKTSQRAINLTWNYIRGLKIIKKENIIHINCWDGRDAWNECRPPGSGVLKYENLTKSNKSHLE
jgi:hypothetical protein